MASSDRPRFLRELAAMLARVSSYNPHAFRVAFILDLFHEYTLLHGLERYITLYEYIYSSQEENPFTSFVTFPALLHRLILPSVLIIKAFTFAHPHAVTAGDSKRFDGICLVLKLATCSDVTQQRTPHTSAIPATPNNSVIAHPATSQLYRPTE